MKSLENYHGVLKKFRDWHGYGSEWSDPLIIKSDEDKSRFFSIFDILRNVLESNPIIQQLLNLKY